jgi:hypothetical protein
MSQYQINLKYNSIDDWVNLPISEHSKSYEYNEFAEKNADGNISYLPIGSPTFTDDLTTAITNQYNIKKIYNYIVSTFGFAEVKVDGAIYNAKVTCNYSKTVQNLHANVIASFSIEKINK